MFLWTFVFVVTLVGYILLEQYSFFSKRKAVEMVSEAGSLRTDLLEFDLRNHSLHRLNVSQFLLFTNTTEASRNVFLNPNLRLWLAPGAKQLLGDEKNIAFMHGQPHKDIRKRFLPLFSRKALALYIPLQENVIRRYMANWLAQNGSNAFEIWPKIRDLNIETSQNVFIGPYVDDVSRPIISNLYLQINAGFLTIPFNLPFSTFRKAIRARETLVSVHFLDIVKKARAKMSQTSASPACLLDFFIEEDAKYPDLTPDLDVAYHLLDFLFASQDASTASLVWVFHLMNEHPDVLRRVREEQSRVRPNDEPLNFEVVQQMPFTRQVVKEILRFRPPAVMVPHEVPEDTTLGDGITCKKGTVILPSVWHSSFEGFTNPEKFDPDRFSPERKEDQLFASNFLVFGTGAHQCIGKEYAMNHLTAFLALAVTNFNWERVLAKGHDNIDFRPTIVPGDGCVVRLFNRKAAQAAVAH